MNQSRSFRLLSPARLCLLLTVLVLQCTQLIWADSPVNAELDVSSLSKSVVKINVVREGVYNGRIQKSNASGSGFFFTADGHILTNYHVVQKPVRIEVSINNQQYPAQLLGVDTYLDLAVLKIEPGDVAGGFKPASIGDSTQLKKGETVFALGSPANLSEALTKGIISNAKLNLPSMSQLPSAYGRSIGSLVDWIAHDASIFGGNSGGPLFDRRGNVIGINEIGIARLGGAIPIHFALPTAQAIIETGAFDRSWIGVDWRALPELEAHRKTGVYVAGVYDGFPAQQAGVVRGDIVTAIDGEPIRIRSVEEIPGLLRMIYDQPTGSEIVLQIDRGGKLFEFKMQTAKLYPSIDDWLEIKRIGVVVHDLNAINNIRFHTESVEGIRIIGARKGFPAAEAQPEWKRNDVLLKLGDTAIRNTNDFYQWAEQNLQSTETITTVATLDRDGAELYSVLTIEPWSTQQPPPIAKRGWYGVSIQALTRELCKQFGYHCSKGFRITEIFPEPFVVDSPLLIGDVIFKVDGRYVKVRNEEDYESLDEVFRNYQPGSEAFLTIERDGVEQELSITLQEEPKHPAESERFDALELEMAVREIVFDDQKRMRWNVPNNGVVVDSVEAAGWSNLAGVPVGSVITQMNGISIHTLADFQDAFRKCSMDRPAIVSLVTFDGVTSRLHEIKPNWQF